jgi:hypothetical protein
LLAKAIRSPSGENAGLKSSMKSRQPPEMLLVMLIWSEPSAAIV